MRKMRRVRESERWKTRKQEVRMSKMEGLLDTINSIGIEDICVAQSFLNYFHTSSIDV